MPAGPSELSWPTLGHPDSDPPHPQSCPCRPAWGYVAPERKGSLPYPALLGGRTPRHLLLERVANLPDLQSAQSHSLARLH